MYATKPMLALSMPRKDITFPKIIQPKLDGVRSITAEAGLVSRAGYKFNQPRVRLLDELLKGLGLDGELTLGAPNVEGVFNRTSGFLNSDTDTSKLPLLYNVYDMLSLTESQRDRLISVDMINYTPYAGVQILGVQSHAVHSLAEAEEQLKQLILQGYEGAILREPYALYKEGRATASKQQLIKLVHEVEGDMEVIEVESAMVGTETEMDENNNGAAKLRVSKSNEVSNGMVGAMVGIVKADVVCSLTGAIVVKAGDLIRISAGNALHALRKRWWKRQHEIVGKVVVFRGKPYGSLNTLRHARYKGMRYDLWQ